MSDEPTLGEVMRHIRALVDQVRDLVKEVRSDYVRRDVYDARHDSLKKRVDDIERENDDREKARVAFQRQVMAGLIVGVLLLIAQTIVTVMFLTGGVR